MSRPKKADQSQTSRVQILLRKALPREAVMHEIWNTEMPSALRQEIFRNALAIGLSHLIRTGTMPVAVDDPERAVARLGVYLPVQALIATQIPQAPKTPPAETGAGQPAQPQPAKRSLSGIM